MTATDVLVRPLARADLDEADRIFRLAFGTFLGMPDPERFAGGADVVRTRWKADPTAAFAAVKGDGEAGGGRLAGSNFAANWGSVAFFGPLTVAPEHWDHAIGQRLLDATMELFARWNTRHIGLFTFAHSPKHVGLYQKYGFCPGSSPRSCPVPSTPASRPPAAPPCPACSPGRYPRRRPAPRRADPPRHRGAAQLAGTALRSPASPPGQQPAWP